MIPGSNQSPSDIETKDMALNEAGDQFTEVWKPLAEVRAIALSRHAEMCDRTKEWHYGTSGIETECREWLEGQRLLSDASMIAGDTVEEKAETAFSELRKPDHRKALDDHRDKTVEAINNATDPAAIMALSEDQRSYLDAVITPSDCEECLDFMAQVPNGASIRRVFDALGANCGADSLRKLVSIFGQEGKTAETEFTGTLADTLQLARPDMIDVAGIEDHKPTALEKIGHQIHCLWVPNDRTGTLRPPLKLAAPAIPSVGSFDEKFPDVSDARAASLWAENKPMSLFWSGGIDSTVALVALLKTVPDGRLSDLTVHLSAASIEEYPEFYTDHIDGKITTATIPSSVNPTDRFTPEDIFSSKATNEIAKALKTNIVITGELGDQIFGSAGFANNPDKIGSTVEDYLANESLTSVRDEIDALMATCPIPANSVTTMMWWWNFTVKWSEVRFRSLTAVDDSADFANVRHFFDTDDFQKWSIANDDLKIKDTIQSYKWTAKDYIHDFAGDDDYRDKKLKVGSLRVRWGAPIGIDSNNHIIKAGDTSTSEALLQQRYSNKLQTFVA